MKLNTTRASRWGDVSPCDEAVKVGPYKWQVELNSLDDLIKFIDKYDDVIIGKNYGADDYHLTIYDDYVE